MASIAVSAVAQTTAQDSRLVVSVSGTADGLPRTGLVAGNFDVVSFAGEEDDSARQQVIAKLVEGPMGVYQLVLEQTDDVSSSLPGISVYAITVMVGSDGGWAGDRGQTVVIGATR